ncbi:hypothetical protein [Variovorax sp. KK3]|uniref:hypothetical protein n=1 Tax=Variovorax sp. KK3 TaxID=1855728 RepID=UPI00117CBB38|nr:hypothetical protein [Variovorax sp. KK3]
MIPELHISKVQSNLYEARLLDGKEEIFPSEFYESITDAIRGVAEDFPAEISEFLEVGYVDVSIGTQWVGKMKAEPAALAEQLVNLAAAVWQSQEERGACVRQSA